jgi:hypothetical protein
MLIVRDSQFRSLADAQVRRFEDTMAAHLKARFPTSKFTGHGDGLEDGLRDFVLKGMRAAASYGVTDTYDVRRFLEFRAEYGPAFDSLAWAAKILNDRTLSGCGKMDQLDTCSLYTLRAAAGSNE